MPLRPILILPTPEKIAPPKGTSVVRKLGLPNKDRQAGRFSPLFDRLLDVLGRADGRVELRQNPNSLAPDRVIVFEVAGSVQNFVQAISKIEGLEFLAEMESEFSADEDFTVPDTRKGKEGQFRSDKLIPAKLYLAMPDTTALNQLVSLWQRWKNNERLGTGFSPFEHVFAQLRDLRPWGPKDRVPAETISYWRMEVERQPSLPIRTEVDLWFRASDAERRKASGALREVLADIGGILVHEVILPEIAYHGALIDIPQGEIARLLADTKVHLAVTDDIMFLRPQSILNEQIELEALDGSIVEPQGRTIGEPIAALFDGVPVQNHASLAGRLRINDPDGLESRSIVVARAHGTAMASLIVHGDLNLGEAAISRPLYIRPIMFSDAANGRERSDGDRLLVDTIFRAVLEMKGTESSQGAAPEVFLVNFSIGDERRPFSNMVSPLARLLDYLSYRYNILFLVSAGNITDRLALPAFRNWTEFAAATGQERENGVIAGLHAAKHERSILSPAEGLNVLTVGGLHRDHVGQRQMTSSVLPPYNGTALPNISSALGLGYRRAIKPEIFMPSGCELVRMQSAGDVLEVKPSQPGRLYGLKAAAPDSSGRAALNATVLSDGTSSATALATRAAHRVFELLSDRDSNGPLADLDPAFRAVVIKALLVHGARWPSRIDHVAKILGPNGRYQDNERKENICRFLGFGVPNIAAVTECTLNRATLIGFGELRPQEAHNYRIPLPECLERVTDPRELTVTLAWFSPTKPGNQRYRSIRLEAAPLQQPIEVIGVERASGQPTDAAVKRGTIFHEHYSGKKAVPFVDDGNLCLRVWCKEDAGSNEADPIRYGIAVTLAAETMIPVYDEVRALVAARVRPTS